MQRTQLGDSGVEVSVLCLGTDSLGSKIDRETSFQLLDFYRERGGCWLDTGNFYASWVPGCQGGESETLIGKWLADRGARDEMVVATKLGFDYPGCDGGLSAAEIERECEKSLKRLGTDRIDLYYAHRDDPGTALTETMEAFHRLIGQGKVRAIAASNLPVWRIAEANVVSQLNGWTPYCAVQQRHTYVRPRHGADFGPQICINDDLKSYCRDRRMTLVAYSALLQGAYSRADRDVPPHYAGPDADERIATLETVAAETGATVNQVILAWMLQGEPRVLPIIAGSRTKQLQENIDALSVSLTRDQLQGLDTAGNPEIDEAWIQ